MVYNEDETGLRLDSDIVAALPVAFFAAKSCQTDELISRFTHRFCPSLLAQKK